MDNMNEMISDGKVEKVDGKALAAKSFSNPALLASKLFETASTKPHEAVDNSSTKGLKSLAEEITQSLSGFKSLRLSMDRDMKQVIVRVVDKDTDNVIRQIPGERMMDLVKQMRDLEGILVKATA
ncbi:MAG: flagellar protein FlaG [Magnetococcales bacterium]|nr:flagellar protein FlaG [Magnetococcales bacterium]